MAGEAEGKGFKGCTALQAFHGFPWILRYQGPE